MHRTAWLAVSLALLTVAPLAATALPDKTEPQMNLGEKVEVSDLGILAPLGCSLGSGQTVLAEGAATTGTLTASTGANCEFVFTPNPAFNGARFVMSPATSDFDLYIKKGAVPTTSVYDCRPFSGGTATETCLAAVTDATPIYAMVRRFGGSGDFTISAQSKNLSPLCPAGNNALAVGATVEAAAVQAVGGACYYQLTPDPAADVLSLTGTPEGAAFGMYVKRGAVPTTSSYDCIASASFVVRTCNVVLDGQDVYVMMRRSSAAGVGQFSLTSAAVSYPQLTPGQPIQATVPHLGLQYYKVIAPAGSKAVAVGIVGTSPAYACNAADALSGGAVCGPELGAQTDADLYVRHASRGALPYTLYDCRSWSIGTNDVCVLSTDAAGALAQAGVGGSPLDNADLGPSPVNVKNYVADGKYFVAVRGYRGPADYTITAVVV